MAAFSTLVLVWNKTSKIPTMMKALIAIPICTGVSLISRNTLAMVAFAYFDYNGWDFYIFRHGDGCKLLLLTLSVRLLVNFCADLFITDRYGTNLGNLLLICSDVCNLRF